jgi:N4-gp56 family major capsid protein
MAQTVIGLNDPKAIKKWSGDLAVDTARKSYFNKKFMGSGSSSSAPIQMLTHLENESGDNISYDLSLQLKMAPIEGDSVLRGNEEDLNFYTDNIYIDQARAGVNTGGRMSRKRTLHDLRQVAKARQSEWWARMFDEQFFMYLSGSRGVNSDFIFPLGYTGRANNPLQAPDAEHTLKAAATLATSDTMSLNLIDRAVSRAVTMGGGTQGTPQIQPVMIDGEEHFVVVMHPWQEYDLRTSSTPGEWLDLQKAATAAEGRKNPIFKGSLGMYNNVVLHSHKSVIRDTIDVPAARALFLGEQAAVCAFGSAGTGMRFDWNEEMEDRGNQVVISTSSIFGIKKCRFNSKDFGVMQLQTAAADPA